MGTSTDGTIRNPDSHLRRNTAVGGGALLMVLAGAYLAGHAMTGDTLPSRTAVQGVPVGGMTPEQARRTVADRLGGSLAAPIAVVDGGTRGSLAPADAGLSVDWEATMRQVDPGSSWNPRTIWNALTGGRSVELVGRVDQRRLTTAVNGLAPTFAVRARNATVHLDGSRIVTTPAVRGRTLRGAETATAVQERWPLRSRRPVAASVDRREPAIGDARAARVVDDTLGPALSGAVTVRAGAGTFSVSVEQIAAATTVTNAPDRIAAGTDMARLYASTRPARERLGLQAGRDARIVITAGAPVVQPSTPGRGISQEKFAAAVRPALARSGAQRVARPPITEVPARFSTEDARRLGVKQVIGQFSTYFPYAEYRNTNLTLAANAINGTLVKPGETFSMDKVLGPRTEEKGYVPGWVISGDVMKEESAGGISQSGTTTFNAAFFAGMTDVEHHPHTMYFDRYPAGREATLYYGQLDLKFRNDTKYGVLVQAYTKKAEPDGRGSITVRMWSTPTWDKVTSTDLAKSNYQYGRTIASTEPDCHAQSPSPGFDVNYSRQFWKDGKAARTEKFFWRYDPTDEVRCG